MLSKRARTTRVAQFTNEPPLIFAAVLPAFRSLTVFFFRRSLLEVRLRVEFLAVIPLPLSEVLEPTVSESPARCHGLAESPVFARAEAAPVARASDQRLL